MWGWWLELLRTGLDAIHTLTGLPWGWSIVVFTAAVRILILPITIKQTRSMLTMQVVQPYVKQLQERYRSDRQQLQVKMMEFYRDNGINPFASCLPILLQLPIMIGLFFVLRKFSEDETGVYAEMREQAPLDFFFGVIPDITQDVNTLGWAGAGFVTFYVVSQLVSSWVMTATAQGAQRYIILALPFLFLWIVIRFPFGLLLFWIVTNVWTFAQHLLITAITDVDREIVLPADKKGRKRVIKRKRDGGGEEIRQESPPEPSNGESGSGPAGGQEKPAPDGSVRPNKRRRKR